jgi:hypothetical protein
MEDLIFVTAQPDVPYFHWQVRVYVDNFIEMGISPNNIHVIFSMVNGASSPSEQTLKLKDLGINIHHYKDDRKQKHYIPSIKPYLVYKLLEDYPYLGKNIFLHDADIVFRKLPDFESLLNDNINYLSDTIGYIGYNYIMDCCRRYESKHPHSEKGQLINEMANIVGIDVNVIKDNQENSGGGQYLIKNSNSELWKKIYENCAPLYDQMLSYQKRFPISPGEIQFWTAEMWSLLWNLWSHNYETKISNELSFSWATDNIPTYEKHPILHMAGVTDNLKNRMFYKGDFININPLDKLRENINFFDYIESDSSTTKYIEQMKKVIKNEL